jgi:L-rhamnose-H+ transport protein
MEIFLGILLVTLAGISMGTCIWPIKVVKKFQFEHFWLIGMAVGLIIIPWLITFLFCPNAIEAYKTVDTMVLVKANIFAIAWGIANVLCGICYVRIGAALTGAVLGALEASLGVIMPMIFKAPGLFSGAPDLNSPAGIVILTGVVVVILGIVIITFAGFGRERILSNSTSPQQRSKGFLGGLIMVIIAGILSCGISFTFIYSQEPIVAAMKANGAGDIAANVAVWAVGLLGGAFINMLYPIYLMTKNKSWGVLKTSGREIILSAIIGIQFFVAIALLGRGMIFLGVLGASVGFGIMMSMQILGNQAVGFISGEWKGIYGKPRRQMYLAITVLILAAIIMAYSKSMD